MLACLARNLDAKNRVTLLHAFPLSAEMWQEQLDALAANGYAAIAPSAFGFGGSPAQPDWTFGDYADALNDLLNALGIEQTTLVGVSMGGYKAFAFWRKYPEKVRSLVLCATRAEADSPEAKKTRYDFIDAVLKNGAQEAVDRMTPRLLGKTSLDSRPDVVRRVESLIRQAAPEAIAHALKALAERDDSIAILSTISVPTLVLGGAEDSLTSEATLKVIADGVKGSEMKMIERAGHLPNLERPDVFNAFLLEHLQSLNRR